MPLSHHRLRIHALFTEEWIVLLPSGHALASAPHMARKRLVEEAALAYTAPGETNPVERDTLEPLGLSYGKNRHAPLMEAIIELVKAGLGIERTAFHRQYSLIQAN